MSEFDLIKNVKVFHYIELSYQSNAAFCARSHRNLIFILRKVSMLDEHPLLHCHLVELLVIISLSNACRLR